METALKLLGEHWVDLLQLALGVVLVLGWVKVAQMKHLANALKRAIAIITEAIEETDASAVEDIEEAGTLQDALQAIDNIKDYVDAESEKDPGAGTAIDTVLDEQGYLGQHK